MGIIQYYDPISSFCRVSSTLRPRSLPRATVPFRLRAFSTVVHDKPSICTADELHYVSVASSDWKLALWRYHPSPQAPPRNHPLLLLSGVGTNAVGYDLSPRSSFARYMCGQGFETWILEVRGAGLSVQASNSKDIEHSAHAESEKMKDSPLYEQFDEIRGKLATLLERRQSSSISNQIYELSQKLVNIIEAGQLSVSPPLFDLQARFTSTLEEFQKQVDLIVKYNWDLDHYLEEDVPAAIEYILKQSKPKDGKLLAIGHSMGGILLYSMLSRFGFEGKEPKLAAVVTLASSLYYTSSKSTLKLLLPLADPAQALNVPVVPLGAMLVAAYEVASRSPYAMTWLNTLVSAEGMMDPDLFKRLILNNFCTIPAKLLLQLTTAFKEHGFCNRDGTFFYKDHLHKSNTPILAIAGDEDLICPPEAVEETVKLIPEHLVTYKVFGDPKGPHYAHYDLVGGRLGMILLWLTTMIPLSGPMCNQYTKSCSSPTTSMHN